jgi:hypothetical protein
VCTLLAIIVIHLFLALVMVHLLLIGRHSPPQAKVCVHSVPRDPPLTLFWDLTTAKYDAASPEPGFEFYFITVIDTEAILATSNLAANFVGTDLQGLLPP